MVREWPEPTWAAVDSVGFFPVRKACTQRFMIQTTPALSRLTGAEDLAVGDFVAVLATTFEVPSFFWCHDAALDQRHLPVRIELLYGDHGPLRIRAICLPLVFVASWQRDFQTLDVRRQRLARLDQGYAETVWRLLKRKKKEAEKELRKRLQPLP